MNKLVELSFVIISKVYINERNKNLQANPANF